MPPFPSLHPRRVEVVSRMPIGGSPSSGSKTYAPSTLIEARPPDATLIKTGASSGRPASPSNSCFFVSISALVRWMAMSLSHLLLRSLALGLLRFVFGRLHLLQHSVQAWSQALPLPCSASTRSRPARLHIRASVGDHRSPVFSAKSSWPQPFDADLCLDRGAPRFIERVEIAALDCVSETSPTLSTNRFSQCSSLSSRVCSSGSGAKSWPSFSSACCFVRNTIRAVHGCVLTLVMSDQLPSSTTHTTRFLIARC